MFTFDGRFKLICVGPAYSIATSLPLTAALAELPKLSPNMLTCDPATTGRGSKFAPFTMPRIPMQGSAASSFPACVIAIFSPPISTVVLRRGPALGITLSALENGTPLSATQSAAGVMLTGGVQFEAASKIAYESDPPSDCTQRFRSLTATTHAAILVSTSVRTRGRRL